jgi:hypothetical protein
METVKGRDEILRNLQTLDGYRKSSDKSERVFWENLIKLGRCFVAFESDGQFIFGPSRFVGYLDNDMVKHKVNREKDGRVTNKALYNILERCSPDDAFEKEFVVFCSREGIVPSNKQRKYWIA